MKKQKNKQRVYTSDGDIAEILAAFGAKNMKFYVVGILQKALGVYVLDELKIVKNVYGTYRETPFFQRKISQTLNYGKENKKQPNC